MKILAVGGGSGGHVTPVAAVLAELSKDLDREKLEVTFVCDSVFRTQAEGIMGTLPFSVTVRTIPSGKLRRYAHFSWWHYVRHFSIILANAADVTKTSAGFFASLWLLIRFRPQVVFAKGGYVCLPMGLAARLCRIPLVIHDSDALPGLTSRILSRFATAIGTGMPLENYMYNPVISQYVGVPIKAEFQPVTSTTQRQFRRDLGLSLDAPLVVAVGGGLGSVAINNAMVAAASASQVNNRCVFYNITGIKHYNTVIEQTKQLDNYHAEPFVYQDMHKLLGAADVVVTRASATTLQELAGLRKTVIAVPAKQLGDQQKNAALFAKYDAVVALTDDELCQSLPTAIALLLNDPKRRQQLASNLHQFAKPNAASDMAKLITKAIRERKKT